jgi:hypothetical protein
MVCFQTKNSNLGKFCRVLQLKILEYFMTLYILLLLGIVHGRLKYIVVIRYIFPVLVFWTTKNLATLEDRAKILSDEFQETE